MKWFEPITVYQHFCRQHGNLPLDEFCELMRINAVTGGLDEKVQSLVAETEALWIRSRRPYFNVHPEMRAKLESVSLKGVSGDTFRKALIGLGISSLLVRSPLSPAQKDGCLICIDEGPWQNDDGSAPRVINFNFYLGDQGCQCLAMSDEPRWKDLGSEWASTVPPRFQSFASVVLGSLLLDISDRLLVEPVLLNKDIKSLSRIGEAEAINRAKRRGVVGWDIGKKLCDINRSAHYRNAHLALFWTGAGRKTPVVKFRSGSFVRPTNRVSVPTGYLGDIPFAST